MHEEHVHSIRAPAALPAMLISTKEKRAARHPSTSRSSHGKNIAGTSSGRFGGDPPTARRVGHDTEMSRGAGGRPVALRAMFVSASLALFAYAIIAPDVRRGRGVAALQDPSALADCGRAFASPPLLEALGLGRIGATRSDGNSSDGTCAPLPRLRGRAARGGEGMTDPAGDADAPVSDLKSTSSDDAEMGGAPLWPRPVVIAGPSGVGKGTLINLLLERYGAAPESSPPSSAGEAEEIGDGKKKATSPPFGFSVSHTTRSPRPGEIDGTHYHFSTREQMDREVSAGSFIESAEVHGNLYGTSYSAVQSVTESGRICVLDIDVQGVRGMKRAFEGSSGGGGIRPRYVFIAPPSMEELENRLRSRGTETEESILVRTANAAEELQYGTAPGNFDAIVVNGDRERALEELVRLMEGWYPHLLGWSGDSKYDDEI